MEKNCSEVENLGPNSVDVSQIFHAEQIGHLLEVKILCDFESSEQPSLNVPIYIDNFGVSTGSLLINHKSQKLEQNQIGTLSERHHFPQSQQRNSKAKPIIDLTGTWSVHPDLQESSTCEAENVVSEGSGEKKMRGRKRKQIERGSANEFSQTRNHMRYLLHRIKYEQNLNDAYSSEGWKRQSLEKLKPEKELQHARSQILRYKLKIRDLFQHIDHSLAEGKLPGYLFDSNGEINSEDIFCAKCGSKDLPVDNDIVLCDGACQRGFHQFCLDPPLLKEQIPPDDEGWLCPGCECKVDCIHMLKDIQETNFSILDSWEKFFPDAAAASLGKKLDDAYGSSSHDTENKNCNRGKLYELENFFGDISRSDEQSLTVSEDLAAHLDNKRNLGILSEDSDDDDFDPSALDRDELVKQESSSSAFTSDREDIGGLLDVASMPCLDLSYILPAPSEGPISYKEKSEVDVMKRGSHKSALLCLPENCDEPSSSKRHVKRLDYKKLNDGTYGNSSSSSDEDFEDIAARKKKRMSSTSVKKNKRGVWKKSEYWPVRTREIPVDGGAKNPLGSTNSAHPNKPTSECRYLDKSATQVGDWFDTHWRFHHGSKTSTHNNGIDSGNHPELQDEIKPTDLEMPNVTDKASSVGVSVRDEPDPLE